MKQFTKTVVAVLLALVSLNVYAFDLSDLGSLLGNGTAQDILNSVISKSNLEVRDLAGTWTYKAPAVAFESEDLLKKAGGEVMASTIENKIAPYYVKAGLQNTILTISADGAFTITFKKGKLTGTVTKLDDGRFAFKFNALGRYKIAQAEAYVKKGTTLQVTFNVTKLIDIVSKIAAYSKQSTLTSAATLLKSYKGLYAGFEYNAK